VDPRATSHVDDVAGDEDLVIAVCDHAHESLPAGLARLHWSVPDPVPTNTNAAFESAYADLTERIGRVAPVIPLKEKS
jgi:protein-tyrosine-phosphatase